MCVSQWDGLTASITNTLRQSPSTCNSHGFIYRLHVPDFHRWVRYLEHHLNTLHYQHRAAILYAGHYGAAEVTSPVPCQLCFHSCQFVSAGGCDPAAFRPLLFRCMLLLFRCWLSTQRHSQHPSRPRQKFVGKSLKAVCWIPVMPCRSAAACSWLLPRQGASCRPSPSTHTGLTLLRVWWSTREC